MKTLGITNVPKQLTGKCKCYLQNTCCNHLEWYDHEYDSCLNCIITEGETWIQKPNDTTGGGSICNLHSWKICCSFLLETLWWHCSETPTSLSFNIFLEPGTSVTRTKYCDMLRNEMRRAICMKWRGRLSDVSLHDNVPPRMAAHTINIFQKLNWKVIEHSAYSFHLAVSISLGILKYAPLAYWLANDDKVK